MTLKKNLRKLKAQSLIEYLLIFVVFALALISTDFFGKAQQACDSHFTQISTQIKG